MHVLLAVCAVPVLYVPGLHEMMEAVPAGQYAPGGHCCPAGAAAVDPAAQK